MNTPHQIAAKITSINAEVISFLQARAKEAFDLVNTEGQQQAILDAFKDMGLVPAQAVATYSAFYGALAAIGKQGSLPAPDTTVFQIQEDGSVLYVAPASDPETESE